MEPQRPPYLARQAPVVSLRQSLQLLLELYVDADSDFGLFGCFYCVHVPHSVH